jgi:hypothetical protein
MLNSTIFPIFWVYCYWSMVLLKKMFLYVFFHVTLIQYYTLYYSSLLLKMEYGFPPLKWWSPNFMSDRHRGNRLNYYLIRYINLRVDLHLRRYPWNSTQIKTKYSSCKKNKNKYSYCNRSKMLKKKIYIYRVCLLNPIS